MSNGTVTPGALRKPSHGKGMLRYGSRPGDNMGGAGQPPSEVRARLRGSAAERIATLEEIADSPTSSNADRTRAIDLLLRYGLGQLREISTEDVADKLRGTIALIRRDLPPEQADKLLARMREIWQ